ncbi:protein DETOXIFICATION 34 [Salvia divinorum]|uniref:Protein DETOXIFICATION 34 n=1 Tax=Salvia divinorum TaxID=28513 RepID=A0ABD1GQ75_SALDI
MAMTTTTTGRWRDGKTLTLLQLSQPYFDRKYHTGGKISKIKRVTENAGGGALDSIRRLISSQCSMRRPPCSSHMARRATLRPWKLSRMPNFVGCIEILSSLLGMASALETLGGQAYGTGEIELLGVYMQRSCLILTGACVCLLPIYIYSKQLLKLLGQSVFKWGIAGAAAAYDISAWGNILAQAACIASSRILYWHRIPFHLNQTQIYMRDSDEQSRKIRSSETFFGEGVESRVSSKP